MSTVLLTGATGFIGSHLLDELLGRGIAVVVLKRSGSGMGRLAAKMSGVRAYDIDKMPLRIAFEQQPIDAVVHLAASYGRKGESVAEVIATNVVFGMQLLETAAEFGVPVFINTSTFSVKGALTDGLAYYVLTKRHFSEYGERFAVRANMAFVDMQLEHVYGPADDETKFVPMLVRALVDGRAALELTPGAQRRDFVYVSDVVAAYARVLERRPARRGSYLRIEVGSGEAVALADFARLAREVAASPTILEFGALPYRAGELMYSAADSAPLRSLGWAPAVALREGLERTVAAARRAASGERTA